MKIKLSDFCKNNSISYITGYRWFKNGELPGAIQTESKTILVDEDLFKSSNDTGNNQEAISVFLKKAIEFSKNNSSIEDFAAYVLSNFKLNLNNSEEFKSSKNKEKEDQNDILQNTTRSNDEIINILKQEQLNGFLFNSNLSLNNLQLNGDATTLYDCTNSIDNTYDIFASLNKKNISNISNLYKPIEAPEASLNSKRKRGRPKKDK